MLVCNRCIQKAALSCRSVYRMVLFLGHLKYWHHHHSFLMIIIAERENVCHGYGLHFPVHSYIFVRLFNFKRTGFKGYLDDRARTVAFRFDLMTKLIANTLAKIKTNTACFFIQSAITTCVAFFKYTG